MADDNTNKKPDDTEHKQERIRKEIAEYEALLEDELKPISLSFGKDRKTGDAEQPGSEQVQQTAPAVSQDTRHKETVDKTAEPPPEEKTLPETPETKEETINQRNKVEILEELAEMYEQTLPEAQDIQEPKVDEETIVFRQMIEEYIPDVQQVTAGQVMEVPIVVVRADYALVDLGGKSEAVVDIQELADENGEINIHIGDKIKVMITGFDEESGQVQVSHRNALQQDMLDKLIASFHEHRPVQGKVQEIVRAGLLVDINGIRCFMPASQIDTTRTDDFSKYLGERVSALVVDADPDGKRIVISRRRLLEDEMQRQRDAILSTLNVGEETSGKVKAVMDFGVFVDLGGIDGFIPRDEISWDRGVQTADFFKEGKQVKVKVIALDKETGKITLSRKRLKGNPWESVDVQFPAGKIVRGDVVSVLDYGAFVRVAEGLTGLIHISDISWSERIANIHDHLKEGQRVRCAVLEIDKERQRMSLGLKQLSPDPWEDAKTNYPVGQKVTGTIRSVTDRGILVDLEDDVQGVVDAADISWERRGKKPQQLFKRGDEITALAIGHDDKKRRIDLGIKQIEEHPFDLYIGAHPEGSLVQGKVRSLTSFGAFVLLAPGVEGLLHVSEMDLKRVQDPKEIVSVGQSIMVKIIGVDSENKKLSLSRKEHMLEEEKREVQKFLKTRESGGLKLGDLLKNVKLQKPDD